MTDMSVGEVTVVVYEIDLSGGKKYVLTVPGKLSWETHQRMRDAVTRWAHDPNTPFLVLDGGMTLVKVNDEGTRPQMDEGWQEYFALVIGRIDEEKTTQGKLVQALLCARYLLSVQIDGDVAQRGRDVINYAIVHGTVSPRGAEGGDAAAKSMEA